MTGSWVFASQPGLSFGPREFQPRRPLRTDGHKDPMLYLASQSPRRRELLGRLGLPFGIIDLDLP